MKLAITTKFSTLRVIIMSDTKFENKIVDYISKIVGSTIKSISIIGSSTKQRRVGGGSDIDIVIVVDSLDGLKVNFSNVFYKLTTVDDSQGKRIELNTKLEGVVLDITILDKFNIPNSPLTDYYENHLGWCEGSICIYGVPFPELFDLVSLKSEYNNIRSKRLSLVKEKIKMTERKIKEQGRRDLYIIYELQKYIFIRELIERNLFNRLSLKHPEDIIPNFDDIYKKELKEKCGITVNIKHYDISDM